MKSFKNFQNGLLRKSVAIAAIVVAASLLLTFPLGRFLVVGEEKPKKADLCHVLASARERTVYAAKLYQDGLCDTILVVGGYEQRETSFAATQKAMLVDLGVPSTVILMDETDIFSTFAEIERLKSVITNGPIPSIKTVSLISDPYHMRRVRMVATWLLDPSIGVQMAPVPFDATPLSQFWLGDKHSRNTVLREYAKLLYYQLRYRLRSTFAGDWLVSLEMVND